MILVAETDPSAAAEPQATRRTARHVFRREGEYWTIEYGDGLCRLRDCAGLRQIAELLARPGQPVAATELLDRHGRPRASDALPRGTTAARATSDSERARVSVTRAIRTALLRLGTHLPHLVEHFNATIHTGTQCAYRPDPRLGATWEQ